MIKATHVLGNGTVAIGITKNGDLVFENFSPARKIGENLKDVKLDVTKETVIEINSLESLKVLQCALKEIEGLLTNDN